jgi:acyl carrier protein
MTRDEIKQAILEEIDAIAPGAIPADLDEAADLRERGDLDSMDMLNLLAALHRRLGVEVPDADQARFVTLKGGVDYLAARLG